MHFGIAAPGESCYGSVLVFTSVGSAKAGINSALEINMTRHSYVLFLAALLLLVSTAALAQDTGNATAPAPSSYDMKSAVERGLEANPSMVAARAALSGASYGTWSAASDLGPTATATYGKSWLDNETVVGAGRTDTYWATHLNISQPLFAGFALLSSLQKAALNEEYFEANLDQAELNLIKEIQSEFLNLLTARMNVKSAQDAVDRLQSQAKVTQAFYDVGLKPKLDVLQAAVDLATAQQDLLMAKNAVATRLAKLNTLLNLPLNAPVEYVGGLESITPFTLTLEDCLAKAYELRPDIIMGLKSARMAAKDSNIALADVLPAIYGDFDWYKKGDDAGLDASDRDWNRSSAEYWTASVNLSYTLKPLGGDVADILAAEKNLSKMLAQLEETRLGAGYEVKEKYLNLQEAADRIEVARKAVEAAREAYRMSEARYQAQVGTNTDVLDAQANLSMAEAQLISALSDYHTALAELYAAMGVKNPGLQ